MRNSLPTRPQALPPTPLDEKTLRLREARLNNPKLHYHTTEKSYPILNLGNKMPFGKYKGLTVSTIIANNPSYIFWLMENTMVLFSEDVILALEETTDPCAPPKAWESPKY